MSDGGAPAIGALTRDGIEAADPGGMLADVLAQPLQLGDALWRAQSAGIRAVDRPGGLIVCGMGGSAIGGDLAAAALGDRATRADHDRPRLRAGVLDRARQPRPVLQLLRGHRGDAGLLRGRRRGRRGPGGAHHRREAGPGGARGGRARDRRARRDAAARRGAVHHDRSARVRGAVRRRARRCTRRSTARPACSSGWRRSGDRTRPRTPRPSRSPGCCAAACR